MTSGKQPIIEIVSIGSELISWIKEENNSRFITNRLENSGFFVRFRTVVGDNLEHMDQALRHAMSRSQIIFISGGLGPTLDDITKDVIGKLLGKKVRVHKTTLEKIRRTYKRRALVWTPSAARQAMVIEDAEVLENDVGHAPGMMLTHQGKVFILLPGVPAELKSIYDKRVHEKLVRKFKPSPPERKMLKLTGLPEAKANDMVAPLIPSHAGIKVLFTVGKGELLIRMETEKSGPLARQTMKKTYQRVKKELGDRVFSSKDESLEKTVARMLLRKGLTIATAESCTGGLLAHRLTSIPGSSNYFLEGTVAYTNEAKISRLGVQRALLVKKGAVSPEVAEAMAGGIMTRAGTSLGISITGIAGPGGGTKAKPVGLVYIALAHQDHVFVQRFFFSGSRSEIKFRSSQAALDIIRLYIRQGSLLNG